jgi:S-adenosyl-L-methionine hydrolase (adenosine-forming)
LIVTLLSDFGTADSYVAAMKGVILSQDPGIRIVDITHEIAAHDFEEGAFLLLGACGEFPAGTVHLAVVDPGVGSPRRGIAIRTGAYHFVGPDNGIFSYAVEREGPGEAYVIENQRWLARRRGTTFHGRDVFAPVAARLATGSPIEEVGGRIEDPVVLPSLGAEPLGEGSYRGRVLHVDRFGNCVTNFTRALTAGSSSFRLRAGETWIDEVRPFYAARAGDSPFLIWGSGGFLEISVDRGDAAGRLGLFRGTPVVLMLG